MVSSPPPMKRSVARTPRRLRRLRCRARRTAGDPGRSGRHRVAARPRSAAAPSRGAPRRPGLRRGNLRLLGLAASTVLVAGTSWLLLRTRRRRPAPDRRTPTRACACHAGPRNAEVPAQLTPAPAQPHPPTAQRPGCSGDQSRPASGFQPAEQPKLRGQGTAAAEPGRQAPLPRALSADGGQRALRAAGAPRRKRQARR